MNGWVQGTSSNMAFTGIISILVQFQSIMLCFLHSALFWYHPLLRLDPGRASSFHKCTAQDRSTQMHKWLCLNIFPTFSLLHIISIFSNSPGKSLVISTARLLGRSVVCLLIHFWYDTYLVANQREREERN